MKKYFLLLIAGFFVFGLLAYLFMRGESRFARNHENVLKLFLVSKQVEATLDRDLLMSRDFLLMTYDPIVDQAADVEKVCVDLREPSFGLYNSTGSELSRAIDSYCEAIARKLQNVERFKSENAILKNSIAFIHKMAIDESITAGPAPKSEAEILRRRLLRLSLAYSLVSTSEARSTLGTLLAEAHEMNLRGRSSEELVLVLPHLEKIFDSERTVDSLTTDIVTSDSDLLFQKVRHRYFEEYAVEEASAHLYRRLLLSACFAFVIFIIYNIVLLWRSARDLTIQRDAAETANRAKSLFLANMSHELRTPMHGILSFANFGQKKIETASKEKLKSYFDEIHESGIRLMTLLNDLLDLSKLEAGKMQYESIECDLVELAQSVSTELSAHATSKGFQIAVEKKTPDNFCACDSGRVRQVIANLVSNAIKFSTQGHPIKIELQSTDDVVRCEVINHGVGIPAPELETIFGAFIQGSKTRTGAGGTGLGLAICREIIAQHNGKIWANSELGGKTTFIFEIPKAGIKLAKAA